MYVCPMSRMAHGNKETETVVEKKGFKHFSKYSWTKQNPLCRNCYTGHVKARVVSDMETLTTVSLTIDYCFYYVEDIYREQ
jgi:hypothetical protein